MSEGESVDRLFPIGAFSQREVVDLKLDPLCRDEVDIDALMRDWRAKSEIFRSTPRGSIAATDSDILPLESSREATAKIERLISSYRPYIPAIYELALVPISKLITPQRHVELDYAHSSLGGLPRKLTVDELVNYCLGTPIREAKIDASFLGYPKGSPGEFSYLYQFSSDDQNVRYIPAMPLKPLQDLDVAVQGAKDRYDVKAIMILVGPGLPFVHVLKVQSGRDPSTGRPLYRLLISNGVHRIFRLAELGNTHVAALVQPVEVNEVPDPFIDTRRDVLLGPDPLRVTDLADRRISRLFRWKRSKRVIRLQVKVTQDISFVA